MTKSNSESEASGAWNPDNSPKYTLVLIGDEGKIYKMTGDQWKQFEVSQDSLAATGVIEQLRDYGTYLACVPEVSIGSGHFCVVVNMGLILRNNA
jgi:hypothetical protein